MPSRTRSQVRGNIRDNIQIVHYVRYAPEALAQVPPEFKKIFQQDELIIFARDPAVQTAAQ